MFYDILILTNPGSECPIDDDKMTIPIQVLNSQKEDVVNKVCFFELMMRGRDSSKGNIMTIHTGESELKNCESKI